MNVGNVAPCDTENVEAVFILTCSNLLIAIYHRKATPIDMHPHQLEYNVDAYVTFSRNQLRTHSALLTCNRHT